MKGLLLSILVFVLYVFFTALLAHVFRVDRHSKLFLPGLVIAVVLYLGSYLSSPPDLWFITPHWLAHRFWLDLAVGLLILILNIHNYVDWFFGFNGGFSTSLMLLLFRAGEQGATAPQLIANYHRPDGTDKIYGWRLPRLEETGYLRIDKSTGVCILTPKGRTVALLARFIKTILNLGAGG